MTTPRVAGLALLLGALLASWLAPWPALVRVVSPDSFMAPGLGAWQVRALWFVVMLFLAGLVACRDGYVGAAVALVGAHDFATGLVHTHALLFAVFALVYALASMLAPIERLRALRVLVVLGVAQALVMLGQAAGYDLLWDGFHRVPGRAILGTLGASEGSMAAAFVALTLPLAMAMVRGPLAVACGLVMLAALLVSSAVVPLLAALVGVLVVVASRRCLWWWGSVLSVLLPLTLMLAAMRLLWQRGATWDHHRRLGWSAILRDLYSDPLFGHGLGSFALRMPERMPHAVRTDGAWLTAHSDLLEWVYSTGVVGALLLGGFLWARRAMWRSALAPACASLLVLAAGSFIFHSVAPGCAAVLILACAQSGADSAPLGG